MSQLGIRYFGRWENVPPDEDLVPFSTINPVRGSKNRKNKKHHFVPITYMQGFTERQGRIWIYRPSNPSEPHFVAPASIGFQNYYYSQMLPDGGRENHRLEDLWNSVESVWPQTVLKIKSRRISPTVSFNILGMASTMRVRGPAMRERSAMMIAAKLRAQMQSAEEQNKLPTDLQRYARRFDTVPVGANPQASLQLSLDAIESFGDLCFRLGFEILHNQTGVTFLTSDNPVCIYDARQSVLKRVPYAEDGDVELLFPIDARTLLRGSKKLFPYNEIVRHRNVTESSKVRRYNTTVAQFSYDGILAADRSSDSLALHYSRLVPTVTTERRGNQIVVRDVFGLRPTPSPYVDSPEKVARLREEGW